MPELLGHFAVIRGEVLRLDETEAHALVTEHARTEQTRGARSRDPARPGLVGRAGPDRARGRRGVRPGRDRTALRQRRRLHRRPAGQRPRRCPATSRTAPPAQHRHRGTGGDPRGGSPVERRGGGRDPRGARVHRSAGLAAARGAGDLSPRAQKRPTTTRRPGTGSIPSSWRSCGVASGQAGWTSPGPSRRSARRPARHRPRQTTGRSPAWWPTNRTKRQRTSSAGMGRMRIAGGRRSRTSPGSQPQVDGGPEQWFALAVDRWFNNDTRRRALARPHHRGEDGAPRTLPRDGCLRPADAGADGCGTTDPAMSHAPGRRRPACWPLATHNPPSPSSHRARGRPDGGELAARGDEPDDGRQPVPDTRSHHARHRPCPTSRSPCSCWAASPPAGSRRRPS